MYANPPRWKAAGPMNSTSPRRDPICWSSSARAKSSGANAGVRPCHRVAPGATLWQGLTPALAPELLARALELQQIGSRLGDVEFIGPAAFHRGGFAYIVGDEPAWTSAQRDLIA